MMVRSTPASLSLFALDFDGVLCDSVRETGISGWKAAGRIWPDMTGPHPPPEILARYQEARAVIETGYEAILLLRLLQDGMDVADLLETFSERLPAVIGRSGASISMLKALYGDIRDEWLAQDPDAWFAFNPLYPGIADWLKGLAWHAEMAIVTTKQERFVRGVLEHHGIPLDPRRIFGLDLGLPKADVLGMLAAGHPGARIHFVDDRLLTLTRLRERPELTMVTPYLAAWGYNTPKERAKGRSLNIPIIELPQLFALQ